MINLSFAGCGFLGIYHVGVASCFREYAPQVLVSKIAGASVGSIAAAALICDVSLGQTTSDILSVAVKARSQTLGPLSPRFDLNSLLRERLEHALPQNAHLLCSGRLFISVTRWADRKNVLLSQFNSRQELIQALLCSCFIPFYSGINIPVFQGEKYADGGLSDNLPVLDNNTVTVSPFAGEHDICPQDESCNILQVNLVNTSIAVSPGNFFRLYRILFPPKPEILSKMCQQGFDDALKFLQRKNIITCTRCLGIQSVVKIQEPNLDDVPEKIRIKIEKQHPFDNCLECRYKRQKASAAGLPEAVVSAIQDACDQVNKGLINWFLRRRPVRLLSFLTLPYTIPLDITIVIFAKVWDQLPSLRKEMLSKLTAITDLIKSFVKRMESKHQTYGAMFSCELAIREYDYTPEDQVKSFSYENGDQVDSIKREEKKPAPRRKLAMHSDQYLPRLSSEARMQRKSYAGLVNNGGFPEPVRRKSLTEVAHPERLIKNMKFGFAVGMTSEINKNDKKKDFFQSLKSLGEEENDLNVVQLASKAMQVEREYIAQFMQNKEDNGLGKVFEGGDNEALISYSYVDEDKTLKMTEIYNVTDADTSMVLSDEERELNGQLEWEKNWINPPEFNTVSVVDSLDDCEFTMSDTECEIEQPPELPTEINGNIDLDSLKNGGYKISKPHRKQSFIIVN